MKKLIFGLIIPACIAVFSCSEKEHGDEEEAAADSTDVYSGEIFQSEKLAYGVDTISDNLKNPWAIAFLGDGRMLVSERSGEVLIFQDGKLLEESIKIPDVFVLGEGGLMDIKLHPDYRDNGWIYISYSKKGEGGGGTVIARTKLEGNQFTALEQLFTAQPLSESGTHFGSRIAFDGNGYMFFSSGERGTKENAQNLGNHLGKILRLHDDGKVPDDNPFVDSVGAKPEIWSYGHRNPQGLLYDADKETFWAVEHGPKGGDELNKIEKGKNYGWPVITFGVNYDGTTITEKQAAEGMEQPLTYWVPSIGPCGLIRIKGDRYPGWKNSLLVGALLQKKIVRIELENGQYARQENIFGKIARVRAVAESPSGDIYVATEGPGMLLKIIPMTR